MVEEIEHMIETTDKRALRNKILEVCTQKQQSRIDDFMLRTKAILDTTGLGNEEEYDNNELSQKTQASEEITCLNEALSQAKEEMNFLRDLKKTQLSFHSIVGPGAIVITDKAIFLIAVSTENFSVEGKTLIGISTRSPLYQTMKGLTVGSIFIKNGLTYKITDIF